MRHDGFCHGALKAGSGLRHEGGQPSLPADTSDFMTENPVGSSQKPLALTPEDEFHTRTLHIRKTSEGAVLLAKPHAQSRDVPRWLRRLRMRRSRADA